MWLVSFEAVVYFVLQLIDLIVDELSFMLLQDFCLALIFCILSRCHDIRLKVI